MQKVMGWKEKFLSYAGREILIKSVLYAIPQCIMMCFRIPKSICKRLMSIIFKFWWSSNGNRTIHLADKQTLCRNKEAGGLNFKDLGMMNETFLAK